MLGQTTSNIPIHILYLCNEWKEWSSMRLVMATFDPDKIRKALRELVCNNDVEYGGRLEEMDTLKLLDLNHCLTYAYISTHVDGEFEKK